MTTSRTLLQPECGTTNPLIKLTEFHKHDKTLVTQDGLINRSSSINSASNNSNVHGDATVDKFVNEYHNSSSAAPNTFRLRDLLTSLSSSDNQGCDWAQEFLDPYFNSTRIVRPQFQQQLFEHEQNYFPSLPPPILHPRPIFLDQQLFPPQIEFANDATSAANVILSFLGDNQFAAKIEDDVLPSIETNELKQSNTENLPTENNQLQPPRSFYEESNSHMSHYIEYKFDQQNPFWDLIDPYGEGLKRLEVHDTINAILCFEAAVQKKPDHVDAWLQLGITQHTNEQDSRAICALKK
ncbi:unnamed protein product [Adineta ricciae]|uniref:Uncharacterized protein n=1 Tax=Adineta ricciae TaxID=249248 RepID=A0A816G166_ADIRI|nr:unnamed protein product [Adineta ricciae]